MLYFYRQSARSIEIKTAQTFSPQTQLQTRMREVIRRFLIKKLNKFFIHSWKLRARNSETFGVCNSTKLFGTPCVSSHRPSLE